MSDRYVLEDIYSLLAEMVPVRRDTLRPDIDLDRELRCYGDDCDFLFVEYAERFDVDMSGFVWYFHYRPEAGFDMMYGLIPRLLGRAATVRHIPLTPELLLQSANAGRWLVDYPPHEPPMESGFHTLMRGFVGLFAIIGLAALLLLLFVGPNSDCASRGAATGAVVSICSRPEDQ